MLCNCPSDTAQTDKSQRGPGQLSRAGPPLPYDLLSPDMFLLQADRLRQAFGQGEDQRHNVLRHHRTVDFTSVGQNYITVDQLRKHELMDGRRGRMNPAQLARDLELFRTQRPADDHLCIAKVILNSVITRSLNCLDSREIPIYPLG